MKICITSQEGNIDSAVDPRFGRCRYFIIADPDTMEFEVFENNNLQGAHGAGVQSGQFISERGVEAVLTGNIGPNAFQTLNASGIKIITGVSGNVKDAINRFKNNEFKSVDNPNVSPHSGLK